ncbi:MAG: NADH-quinone oxidoreductase subunit J [Fimbriimonadaceae bacterium]|nr:NADH-quinone oxidoreductase subunit J [Fimbriimonadaceae bacterium]
MTANQVAFLLVGGLAALGATGVVACGEKPVRSALCLVLNFFLLGVLYFMLGAELLGIIQVMVYAGAIMVLFLFVVMVLALQSQEAPRHKERRWPLAIVGAIALAATVASVIVTFDPSPFSQPVGDGYGKPQAIGAYLFTEYALPFEVASVLLLVGIVGSVLLARRNA